MSSLGCLKDKLLAAAVDDDDFGWGEDSTSSIGVRGPSSVALEWDAAASTPLAQEPGAVAVAASPPGLVGRVHVAEVSAVPGRGIAEQQQLGSALPQDGQAGDRSTLLRVQAELAELQAVHSAQGRQCESLKTALKRAEALAESLREERDSAFVACAVLEAERSRLEVRSTEQGLTGGSASPPAPDGGPSLPEPWLERLLGEVRSAVREELREEVDSQLHSVLHQVRHEVQRLGGVKPAAARAES